MRVLLAVCFVVALGGMANAEEHIQSRGIGTLPCGKYMELYRKNPDMADELFFSWAMGYISGVNSTMSNGYYDLNSKAGDEITLFLRQYCNNHPSANYADGVLELMKILHRPGIKTSLKPTE